MIDPRKFACAKAEPMPEISYSDRIISRLRGLVALKMFQQRSALNMTQAEYADHIHVTQVLVSRIENGSIDLSVKKLFELFEPLGLDIEIVDNTQSNIIQFTNQRRSKQTSYNSSTDHNIAFFRTYSSKQIQEG